jgi:quercetin dioxygenase-like cupin family protein
VSPDETSEAFAMIQMIVPPGGTIPLHSHADLEVFYMLEGTLDFLQADGDSNRWLASYATGAVLNVDGGFTA